MAQNEPQATQSIKFVRKWEKEKYISEKGQELKTRDKRSEGKVREGRKHVLTAGNTRKRNPISDSRQNTKLSNLKATVRL